MKVTYQNKHSIYQNLVSDTCNLDVVGIYSMFQILNCQKYCAYSKNGFFCPPTLEHFVEVGLRPGVWIFRRHGNQILLLQQNVPSNFVWISQDSTISVSSLFATNFVGKQVSKDWKTQLLTFKNLGCVVFYLKCTSVQFIRALTPTWGEYRNA